jgi:uncharacterized protein
MISLNQIFCDITNINLEVDDVNFIHPISGFVKLFRQNIQVYATVELSTEIEVECGRCLEKFYTTIKGHFEVQYRLTYSPDKDGWLDEDLGVRYYMGEYIDITEDICQAIVVEIPLWPVCSEDCKGLCPQCGHNLNLGDCNCIPIAKRPSQFAALGELLDHPRQAVSGK